MEKSIKIRSIMKLFDLIKRELIGKVTFTKDNIKFKIESVFMYYDDIKNHFNTTEDIKLSALLLSGKDEEGKEHELVLANNKIFEFVYSES